MCKKTLLQFLILVVFVCFASASSQEAYQAVQQGMLQSMSNYPYNTGTYYATPSYYNSDTSYSSGTNTSVPSSRKCTRCGGTGKCKTCGGTGRVYDYGNMSIVSHEKYDQKCRVCNGSGKCGVCDGKGVI